MEKDYEERYVVCGIRTVNGKSDTMWLDYDRASGGYYSWATKFEQAEPMQFVQAVRILRDIQAGRTYGPWYHEPDPATVKTLLVHYTPARPASMILIRRE